jgi:hypothetical protein
MSTPNLPVAFLFLRFSARLTAFLANDLGEGNLGFRPVFNLALSGEGESRKKREKVGEKDLKYCLLK